MAPLTLTIAPKFKFILTILTVTAITTITITTAQQINEQPKHFTIFDAVGEMASGMAYVHVAIPLNLTTFNTQAKILGEYLFKLSRVVDGENGTKSGEFLDNIRNIARFGQTRLERLKLKVHHLDMILPFDGDMTQQRQKRDYINTLNEDEVINYEKYLEHKIHNPIDIQHIYTDPLTLRSANEIEVQRKIDRLKHEYNLFIKNAKIQAQSRFKRASLTSVYRSQIWLFEDIKQLQLQHVRLRQIQQVITQDTAKLEKELSTLTNLKFVPEMDNIREAPIFDFLHKDLDVFQSNLIQDPTFITHVQTQAQTVQRHTHYT